MSSTINKAGLRLKLPEPPGTEEKQRKVIQLVSHGKDLLALCDDGSIWESPYYVGDDGQWKLTPGPPRKGWKNGREIR